MLFAQDAATETYEKLTFSIAPFPPDLQQNHWLYQYPFLIHHIDSSQYDRQPMLTVSLREKFYANDKLIARRFTGLDNSLDADGDLSAALDLMFRHVDLSGSTFKLMKKTFVNPLSWNRQVYDYYTDTIEIDGTRLLKCSFSPARRSSGGFVGNVLMTPDSLIRQITMQSVGELNIDHVKKIYWQQRQNTEEIYADIRLQGIVPVQAHWWRSVKTLDPPSHLMPMAAQRFSEQYRHQPLNRQESQVDVVVLLLQHSSAYRMLVKPMEIALTDYIPTRFNRMQSRFDFGPVTSLYSYNPVEGSRWRIGGKTTPRMSRLWSADAAVAYGWRDRQFKYQLQLRVDKYSLLHEYDLAVPGEISDNNLFTALRPGVRETQMQYFRKTEFHYADTWTKRLAADLWIRHARYRAAGDLRYQRADDASPLSALETLSLGVKLQFLPMLTLLHQSGGYRISKFSPCHHTELRIEKQFDFNDGAYITLLGATGKIWNKAPFPLLFFPNTNQSLFLRSEAFTTMRPMEFIADEYANLFLTAHLNGLILNHIPLINRLKWRETLSFNAMYGHLTDKNNPQLRPDGLLLLPAETLPFGAAPYLETGFGVENIFKFLRIDFYRRLSYLDAPHIKKWGVRLGLNIGF